MLPMLQAEPLVLGGGGGGGGAVGAGVGPAAAARASGPLAPLADLMDDTPLFCEADVGFDTFHLPGIGSCDLQLGDSWGGIQSKMSVVAPVKKIRKKSDTKPQSQINKCNNEKRRRELENETINQLEELLGACLSDVKQPDKNGIVQEAAAQIRLVLERRRACAGACCGGCPPRCQQACTPVQGGEVSSTQPHRAPPADSLAYFSEISTLIEALKHYTTSLGWVLLEVNSEGDIECVTENVRDIVAWERAELYKQSIYTYLHHGDHQSFTPLLRDARAAADADTFRAIRSRLLVKGGAADEPAGYAEVLIHAAAVRGAAEEAASVMCVIRRCEDASPGPLAERSGPPAFAHKQPAQITFKLDRTANILTCDLSGVGSPSGSPACRALEGVRLVELVEARDRALLTAHLRDSPQSPALPSLSAPFRLRVGHDKTYVTVRAESRLFRSQESDFIMSTHSILSEEETAALEAPATPPVGGPLMTSVANGRDARFRPASPADPAPFSMDFDLDFPQAPWEYPAPARSPADSYGAFTFDELPAEESKERPPAPPASEEPNRLRSLLSKKPEEAAAAGANNRILKDLLKQEDEEGGGETSAPHTPHTPHTPHAPHTPAAAALSPPAPAAAPLTPAPPAAPTNSDMLLRPEISASGAASTKITTLQILNEKSDDDNEESRQREGARGGGGGGSGGGGGGGGAGGSHPSALLTQLLSNGPDGGKQASRAAAQDAADNFLDRFIANKRKAEEMRAAGAPGAKRATPEAQQVTSSALSTSTSPSVPSSAGASPVNPSGAGMSPLCQKNQILVSLLARQQSTPTTPLPSPNPSLRPFMNGRPRLGHPAPAAPRAPPPQQHAHAQPPHHAALTNMLNVQSRVTSVNGGTTPNASLDTMAGQAAGATHSHLQMVLQGSRAYPAPSASPAYPSHPSHSAHPAHPSQLSQHHYRPDSAGSVSRGPRAGGGGDGGGGGEGPNDQMLSDLLDDVINNELEPRMPADLHLFTLNQARTDYAGMKEKMDRINAITQSLMQVENAVKSPSPGVSPAYSAQSPQGQLYGRSGGGGGGGGGGAPSEPPPLGVGGGARARQLAEQHRARLLLVQRTQQMLVPQGAEQAPGDLNNTIEALSNSTTPPNVALTRTDYHHQLYHPSSQVGSTYGTNKITSQQQQNPMLSAQLTERHVALQNAYAQQNAGVMHAGHQSPAALHTPHTPLSPHPPLSPYQQRPPRPHHMGGYYAEVGGAGSAGGYCVDYARRAAAPPPHQHDHALSCGGAAGGSGAAGAASEYVRQEIRAVVGARARPDLHHALHAPPHGHAHAHPPDLDSLGLSFELPSPGGGSVVGGRGTSASTKSWESHQSTPSTTEAAAAAAAAVAGGDEAAGGGGGASAAPAGPATKASLLQKLLSE